MINISKKSDIVFPFGKIGDEGWEKTTEAITRSVLYSWGTSIDDIEFEMNTDDEIDELENKLGTTLPEGLRLFFQTFGVADIGDELQEIDMIGRLSDVWDIDAKSYSGPDFTEEDLEYFPHLITFGGCLGNGSVFCFHDETKEIYYFDHDTKPYITKMFDSVDDYIKGCLINCQIDLFDLKVGQSKVEEWIEEIMIETFGKQIYEKWHF